MALAMLLEHAVDGGGAAPFGSVDLLLVLHVVASRTFAATADAFPRDLAELLPLGCCVYV